VSGPETASWLASLLGATPTGLVSTLAALVPSKLVVMSAPLLLAAASAGPACPDDMVLVDGELCPAVDYACLRPVDPSNPYRCAEYARRGRCRAPVQHRRYCVDRHEWPNRVGENPMVYVSWFKAKELCASAGKRLCRRTEWMMACEGPKRLPYPWGYERQPSPCNVDRASVDFDVYAMIDPTSREEELARLWQADPIGSHPGCVSSWGAFDMSGNVDEWTDDQLDNPGTAHVSTLNGGYWGPVRDTCRLTTTSHGPTFEFYQVGFRCCADTGDAEAVEPPPITVLPKVGAPN
jgi:hypothetical protein